VRSWNRILTAGALTRRLYNEWAGICTNVGSAEYADVNASSSILKFESYQAARSSL
jgi:hypothetical protein